MTSRAGERAQLPDGVLTSLSSVYATRSVAPPVDDGSCVLVDPTVIPALTWPLVQTPTAATWLWCQGDESSDRRLVDPANRAVDLELRAHLRR